MREERKSKPSTTILKEKRNFQTRTQQFGATLRESDKTSFEECELRKKIELWSQKIELRSKGKYLCIMSREELIPGPVAYR